MEDGDPRFSILNPRLVSQNHVVLAKPPSTMMISPVTKRLCKIRLSMQFLTFPAE